MTSEYYKAADRAILEVWSTGDLDRLDDLVAQDVVHHDPYDPQASSGLDGMKKTIAVYRQAFPDAVFTVEDQIAEGDKVVTRWRSVGTHLGSLTGEAPTGASVTCTGMAVEQFEDRKVVEAWRNWDALRLLTSIGALPAGTPRT